MAASRPPREQWHLLDAHEVVALLRDGHVTPAELIDVVEERVATTEGLVYATPTTCFTRGREAAAQLKRPEIPPPGYLYGLPVLIKDTQAVAGVRFTQGSPLYADYVAEESDRLVLQLEERGAVVVGKTNTPEFAAGSQSFNQLFPTTVSPWDTRTTAGGSSGGAAAALASCQCWLASGSDFGGSLRTPAAFCGVVGFRPSPGRVLRTSRLPSGPLSGLHPTDGPMGRCVRDVGLFLDAMVGRAGWDFELPALPEGETFEAAAMRGAVGEGPMLHIGFSTLGCPIVPAVENLCRRAAQALADAAGRKPVQEVTKDVLDFKLAERIFLCLRTQLMEKTFHEVLADPAKKATLKPEIVWNACSGADPRCVAIANEARAQLPILLDQVQTLFRSVDILCTPMTMDAAFDARVRYPTQQAGLAFNNYLEWMMPACIISATSCPSLSLPCGFLEDGRPIGLQLVAPPGADAALLEAAAVLEQALQVPRVCPEPRAGTSQLATVGPRTAEEAAQHHDGEIERFIGRYS